jgi:hypothetical protein
MLEPRHVDIVSIVWMLSPPEVHALGVGIVELVVSADRPLDVNSSTIRLTKAILEADLKYRWIEVVVERRCRERLCLVDNIADCDQG